MSKQNKNMNTISDENAGNKSKEKKKMSKQMKMSVIMVIVSLFILSVSTYAWFLITNTPKVENISLTADTLGDLKIADTKKNGMPGTYGDKIDLADSSGVKTYLSPVTTKNGITFFSPVYLEGAVASLNKETDENRLHSKYVYEKTFYLRAGGEKDEIDQEQAKNYDIFLVGTSANSNNGSYMKQKGKSTSGNEITAANSLRISLTFEGGITGKAVTVIYEPNADRDNKGVEGTNMAFYTYNGKDADKYGAYATIQQNYDRSFVSNSNNPSRSIALDTIREGEDVKVTMRIWLEGMDKDCVNEIAADEIIGQIQFISEENLK